MITPEELAALHLAYDQKVEEIDRLNRVMRAMTVEDTAHTDALTNIAEETIVWWPLPGGKYAKLSYVEAMRNIAKLSLGRPPDDLDPEPKAGM